MGNWVDLVSDCSRLLGERRVACTQRPHRYPSQLAGLRNDHDEWRSDVESGRPSPIRWDTSDLGHLFELPGLGNVLCVGVRSHWEGWTRTTAAARARRWSPPFMRV